MNTVTDDEAREKRIRKMHFEQEEMIFKSDLLKIQRSLEDARMAVQVLKKKAEDIRAQIEEAERVLKKGETELRLKEEEFHAFKKKMQMEVG